MSGLTKMLQNHSTCKLLIICLLISLVSCQEMENDLIRRHVCGDLLNLTLKSLCDGSYNGYDKRGSLTKDAKRLEASVRGGTSAFAPEEDAIRRALFHHRYRRNIVYECCILPCTYRDLQKYCYYS